MRSCVSGRSPSAMSVSKEFCSLVSFRNSSSPFVFYSIILLMSALNQAKQLHIRAAPITRKKAAATAIIPKSEIPLATLITSFVVGMVDNITYSIFISYFLPTKVVKKAQQNIYKCNMSCLFFSALPKREYFCSFKCASLSQFRQKGSTCLYLGFRYTDIHLLANTLYS